MRLPQLAEQMLNGHYTLSWNCMNLGAPDAAGGNRTRLETELDLMQKSGVNHLVRLHIFLRARGTMHRASANSVFLHRPRARLLGNHIGYIPC